MLTDVEIKQCKPKPGSIQRLSDAFALYLIVKPNGARLWRWDYTFDGRRKTISFGAYPVVTLKRARDKRLDAQRLLDAGTDPSVARRIAKVEVGVDTFAAVAEKYLEKLTKEIDPRTLQTKRSRIENYILPKLGALTLTRITPGDVLACCQPLDKLGKHTTARRVRQIIGAVFVFAIATDRATADPSAHVTKALTKAPTRHLSAITDEIGIGRLLGAIHSYTGSPVVRAALQLMPLVFVRSAELRGATWDEFDFEHALGPVWRIPVRRMKRTASALRVDHVVPLAPQAVAILRALYPVTGSGRLVFAGPRHATRPISDMTLTAALRSLGYGPDEQHIHGFRTIASTRCREIGFDGELVELQLGHAIDNPVRAAYDRAARVPERVKMMGAFADHLDDLRARAAKLDRPARRPHPLAAVS